MRRAIDTANTDMPHFPIDISYAGINVSFEDIYFDHIQTFLSKLKEIEHTRKGQIVLDGGLRIKLIFKATPQGGIEISFHLVQFEPLFPGHLSIDGKFDIEGEYVGQLVHSFDRLINAGEELYIESLNNRK